MFLTKRPPAELVIHRKGGTEERFVQASGTAAVHVARTTTNDDHDETYQIVMACAAYTASFNDLLSKPNPHEDSRQLVARVHHRMHAEGIPFNTQTYNLLMKRVVRFTDGSIFTLYEELKNEGLKENSSVRPNMDTYVLLFRACERSAQYKKAFLLHQQLRELFRLVPDTAVYNTLLGYCAAVRDVAQASFLMEEMKMLDVPRDVNTYNCLMSVMVESAPYAETLRVFQELLSLNIKPTNRSYNTILKAAFRHSDYDRAFQLAEEMKKKGLVPDVETYNYLISVCEQRLDYVRGIGAYAKERRTRAQVVPGLHAIAELVMTLLQEMRSIHVHPDTYTYNKALSTLVVCEDERVFVVYNEMVAYANEATPSTNTSVAPYIPSQAAGTTKNASSEKLNPNAGVLLEEALQAEDEGEVGNLRSDAVRPNLETWRQMIRACIIHGYFSRARDVSADFRKSGVSLTKVLALLLLEVCCASKDLTWADELIAELKALDALIDTSLMNAYLRVLCAVDARETVFLEYEQMESGIHPSGAWADTETCNIVLQYAQTKPGKAVFAEQLYNTMVQPYSTTAANEATFCIRLDALTHSKLSATDDVVAYIEEVLQQHPILTVAFYHSVLAFFLARDDERIQVWFDRLSGEDDASGGGGSNSFPAADTRSYTILMEYYLAHEQYGVIEQLFSRIQCSATLEANADVYWILFEVSRRRNDADAAMKLFEQACISCVALSVRCYDSIIKTLVTHESAAVYDVLSYMKEHRVTPDRSTMAAFLTDSNGREVLSELMSRNLFYFPPTPVPLQRLKM